MNKKFALDILHGLTATPKYLPSKYFYDETGDKLFQEIMHLDEYYVMNAELDIIKRYKNKLLQTFNGLGNYFNLIELGAGDGMKTKILLQHFTNQNASFSYIPVDISGNVLNILEKEVKSLLPKIDIETITDDYYGALDLINLKKDNPKVILFMGGNLGNFSYPEARDFLEEIANRLNHNDLFMIGFDLKKDPETICKAYNDSKGITRDFNLNILNRINRELGGNFKSNNFYHYPIYDPATGEAKSYLVSKTSQQVTIKTLNKTFKLISGEAILTEISKKYDLTEINNLAEKTGFKTVEYFYDKNKYFVNVLWQLNTSDTAN